MCGIAGFQGSFPGELLTQMSHSIAHRGPDGSGEVVLGQGRTGLAHRRLSIIDLSANGRQPMTATCSLCGSSALQDLALTYNGEIYNFQELRTELVAQGHAFHSATDTEVLLHLYATHGLAFLEKLNGIFALGLYEGRERGRPDGIERGDLIVARDGIGVKPLYYAEPVAGFIFASEIKALLQCRELSRELDSIALHQTVAYLWTPAPRTVLKSVKKLEPGKALVVRHGRITKSFVFYDIPFGAPLEAGSMEQVAAKVRGAVFAAVERQLIADVPVAAFLSGGVDSSAVVAGARAAGRAIQSYCIDFKGGISGSEGAGEDAPYARRVARHLDVPLEVIEIDSSAMNDLPRMLYYLDEPQADPAPINALLICERARSDGFKVMLGGAGGDDIFSGYRRHRALSVDHLWNVVPHPIRSFLAGAVSGGLDARRGGMQNTTVRRLNKLMSHVDLTADERMIAYFWWNDQHLRNALFAEDFLQGSSAASVMDPFTQSLRRLPAHEHRLNRMLYLEMKHFLADHNLNYVDRMGMAVGVEVRVPLLDLEVVDLAARVPPAYKQTRRVSKAVLKQALANDLPHDILHRSKTGFAAPLRRWLRQELRDMVNETLSETSLRNRGIFRPESVRRLIAADQAGTIDGSYTMFSLMCIELWCRQFIDRAAIANDFAPYAMAAGAS